MLDKRKRHSAMWDFEYVEYRLEINGETAITLTYDEYIALGGK